MNVKPATVANEQDHDRFKLAIAQRLMTLVLRASAIGFPILGIAIMIGFAVPFFSSQQLPNKVLMGKLTFCSIGIFIGIFQPFLGVLLAVIGITVDYQLDAGVGPAKVKLASASPGLLLILCSNLLIAFCVQRELDVTDIRATRRDMSAEGSEPASADEVDSPPPGASIPSALQ